MSTTRPVASGSDRPGGGESTSITETLQSLLVAFVIAMTFRGFFLEGFVIPTGSMAPTLMGAHLRMRSPETAYEFPIDAGPVVDSVRAAAAGLSPPRRFAIYDPMLGYTGPVATAGAGELLPEARMGDRVLVLKFLYPFSAPKRWDVVVFKNPTDPVGDTQNYIKRLVGLPKERLIIVDGDVFAAPTGTPTERLRVQRKPEFIQRAVWQEVYDSDFIPVNLPRLEQSWRQTFPLPPWRPTAGQWELRDRRVWRSESAAGELRWDWQALPIDDRTPYNMFRPIQPFYPTGDLRVAAAIEAGDHSAAATTLDLQVRSHVFRFEVGGGRARVSMRHFEGGAAGAEIAAREAAFAWPRSGHLDLEFWHVDQAMSIWAGGRELVRLEYEWGPIERLRNAFLGRTLDQYLRDPVAALPAPPQLSWRFEGGPVELRRMRLDRDLYYRPMRMMPAELTAPDGRTLPLLGFGSDPEAPAEIGPDQFLMLGDNSAASRDSRVWGYPHPLAALRSGDDSPFIVPRSLLLGKAWCVYFPAPLPYTPGGRAVIPDFGRLRFIR
jgi:signal peptidase I